MFCSMSVIFCAPANILTDKFIVFVIDKYGSGLQTQVWKIYIMTKNNFGLIHVYFLYTLFRATYRALINKVTWLQKKSGWGILSVGRIQLAFDLEIAGGKKSPVFKRSTLSWWRHLATISFLLLSVVLGSAREMCVFSIRLIYYVNIHFTGRFIIPYRNPFWLLLCNYICILNTVMTTIRIFSVLTKIEKLKNAK